MLISCADKSDSTLEESLIFENKNVFEHLSKTIEHITFNGKSKLFPNQTFSGRYSISAEKQLAIGELHTSDNSNQNFEIEIGENSLQRVLIGESKDQFYYKNVLENDELVVISNLSETDSSIKGLLDYGTVSIDFELTKSQDELGTRLAPLIAWAIVAGVSTLTTVGTCAYERSAARNACQQLYNTCNAECDGACYYYYRSGLCGGSCEISC